MKLRGILIKGITVKDGKITKTKKRQSVSERIRQSKSKRVRPQKGPRS